MTPLGVPLAESEGRSRPNDRVDASARRGETVDSDLFASADRAGRPPLVVLIFAPGDIVRKNHRSRVPSERKKERKEKRERGKFVPRRDTRAHDTHVARQYVRRAIETHGGKQEQQQQRRQEQRQRQVLTDSRASRCREEDGREGRFDMRQLLVRQVQ